MFSKNKRYNLSNYFISSSISVLVESAVAFFLEYPNNANEEDINAVDNPVNATVLGSFHNESAIDITNPIHPAQSAINPANLDPDVLPLELLIASANENF